jgi:hypothetical protein
MNVLTQFTETHPRDYVMTAAGLWVADTAMRKIHHLNVQGVGFVGDHHHVRLLLDGSVVVKGWNDDPDDWAPEEMTAWEARFWPIAPDPAIGGMYNTHQEFTLYVHPSNPLLQDATPRARTIRPLGEFVRPPMAEVETLDGGDSGGPPGCPGGPGDNPSTGHGPEKTRGHPGQVFGGRLLRVRLPQRGP